jgi:hypothetical protein
MKKMTSIATILTLANYSFIVWWCQIPGLKGSNLIACYATSYCLAIIGLIIKNENINKTHKYPILFLNILVLVSPLLLLTWGFYVAAFLGGV